MSDLREGPGIQSRCDPTYLASIKRTLNIVEIILGSYREPRQRAAFVREVYLAEPLVPRKLKVVHVGIVKLC